MSNGILQIPKIPILLLNGQGEKTPFVESLPPCFWFSRYLVGAPMPQDWFYNSPRNIYRAVFSTDQNFGYVYRAEPKKAVSYITTKQPRLRFRMGLNQRPHD